MMDAIINKLKSEISKMAPPSRIMEEFQQYGTRLIMPNLTLKTFKNAHHRINLGIPYNRPSSSRPNLKVFACAHYILIFLLYLMIGGNAMAERKEDFDYKNGGEGSPQAARAAFGEPEPWMQWESRDHTHSGGAYGGFHFQDKNKPFILHGGGFDDTAKYIGTYASICPGGMPFIGEDYILESISNTNSLIAFGLFPNSINLIKKENLEKIECKLYPTNWNYALIPSEGIKSHEFFKAHQKITGKLEETAEKTGYKIIENTGDDDRILAKITEKNNHAVRINILFYGKWFDLSETPGKSHDVEFSIPDEIKPYYDEIETSQLSLMTSPAWFRSDGGYMILKNGLYFLKRDP